jgi:hypothetical protein
MDMKPLVVIPVIIAASFIVAAGLLAAVGVHIRPVEPLAAALISIGAGLAGILPIAISRRTDAVGVFQLALVGTILHLLSAVALCGAAIATHSISAELSFIYWLLVGYCVSLAALVWQLRQILLNTIGIAKAQ